MDNTHTLHDRIVGLTVFLDAFESQEFTFGTMETHSQSDATSVSCDFSKTASQFYQAVYDLGWVLTDFDWSLWDEGQRFIDDPEALAQADLADIERLLTTHLRQERFCEGHLDAMYESGHLTGILNRLKVIGQNVKA